MQNVKIIKEKDYIERIESNGLDKSILRKRGNSKTFQSWIIQRIQDARKQKNLEIAIFLDEIRKKHLSFQTSEKFRVEQWRGKSGVKFLEFPDRVIAERYRKTNRNAEAKKVSLELLKEEINRVIWAINKLGNKMETSEIAELVYNKGWKNVFSTRRQHIKLVEILNYLEYRKDIYYSRRGKIKILNQTKISDYK